MNAKQNIIQTAHLLRYRNNDHFRFHKAVIDLITRIGASELNILDLFNQYNAAYQVEDEALQRIMKSAMTEEIMAADKLRDKTYRGMVDIVKGALQHFKPEIASAAKRLKVVLDTYGNVSKLGLYAQSTVIHNLVQDFTEQLKEESQKVGIQEWIEELDRNNKTLDELIENRNQENGEKTDLKVKECRHAIDEIYHTIQNHIIAHVTLQGIDNYKVFISDLNQYIKTFNQLSAQHHNSKAKKKPTDTEQ
ncbi:MAG: DUF6261 family protein [Bacteroidales bacterium]